MYITGAFTDFSRFRVCIDYETATKSLKEILPHDWGLIVSVSSEAFPLFAAGVKNDQKTWMIYDNEQEALAYRDARLKFYSLNELFCYKLERI